MSVWAFRSPSDFVGAIFATIATDGARNGLWFCAPSCRLVRRRRGADKKDTSASAVHDCEPLSRFCLFRHARNRFANCRMESILKSQPGIRPSLRQTCSCGPPKPKGVVIMTTPLDKTWSRFTLLSWDGQSRPMLRRGVTECGRRL